MQGCSEFRNNLALKNGSTLYSGANYEATVEHPRGSQWIYGCAGDPEITHRSLGVNFIHFDGDATNLFNWFDKPQQQNILHASRSIVWLKPDHVVVYDRASSTADGGFKRWCLNMPGNVTINGTTASASASDGNTPKGRLFVKTLLPAGAAPVAETIPANTFAPYEDMKARVIVTSPGDPQETRFLHLVQAAELATSDADATQLITSTGEAYEGMTFGSRCVLFRKSLSVAEQPLSFAVPAGVNEFIVTGMEKFAGYAIASNGGSITISAGTERFSDGGGVLAFGSSEPSNIEITASQATATEGGAPASFMLKRSGDISSPLSVNLSLSGDASAADFVSPPSAVTFAAGSATTTLTLAASDDADFEPSEGYTLRLLPGAGYHACEAANEIRGTISDNEMPPGGTLAFSAASYSAIEGAGQSAVITLTRSGGSSGAVSALMIASNGSAVSGSDYVPSSVVVHWADGDTTPKQVLIPLVNDSVIEIDETVNLSLTQPTGSSALGLDTAVLTIGDDEPPTFELTPSALIVTEGLQTSAVFTITRQGGNATTVSINYTTTPGTATSPADFTAMSGTLSWAPGAAAQQQITIPLNDDTIYEGPTESLTLAISSPSGGGVILGSSTATLTITENDPPPAQFHVGPGQAYETPADVPWNVVGAGSDVLIHYRSEPYRYKILLASRGTSAQPVRLIGVPGPNGERPVLDGENALPPPMSAKYEPDTNVEDQSLIAIERNDTQANSFKPGWIEIRGLELRNAHPDFSYSRQIGGATDSYGSGAAALFLRGAENVLISDCVIHHCATGITTNSGGNNENSLVRGLLIDHCHFHSQGKNAANTYYGHNLLTQAAGVTVQFCRLEPPLTGSAVPNIDDRSAGFTAACNWIEGGGSQINLSEPYSAAPLLTDDPSWGITHVWGNVMRNFGAGSGNVIHFGETYLPGARVLHFHHNTVHCQNNYSRNLLNLHAAGDSALAYNNIIRHSGIAEFRLNAGSGTVVFGAALISPGYITSTGFSGSQNILTSANIGFVDEANGDYHLTAGSPAIDAAIALPTNALPAYAQYAYHATGHLRHRSGAADDLGAFEIASPIDAWLLTHFNRDAATPSIAGDLLDADHDGAVNLLEYALDRDPRSFDSNWQPSVLLNDGLLHMTVTKNPAASDLGYHVEVSSDLQTWNSGTTFTTTLLNSSSTLQVRDQIANPPRFMRLRVTR